MRTMLDHSNNTSRIHPNTSSAYSQRRCPKMKGNYVRSMILLVLPLLSRHVVADLRGESLKKRPHSTIPSTWNDFSRETSGNDRNIVIVDDTVKEYDERSGKWRMLGTGSHINIGISGMIMGKGKGKGGSSSKGSSASKSSGSDCNIFAKDSGKGGKGKGRDSNSYSSSKGGSKGGCYEAPSPTLPGYEVPSQSPPPQSSPSQTPPSQTPPVPGFPIFSDAPFEPTAPTLAPGSGSSTEPPANNPTPNREPTPNGPRCTVGSDGLFGSQLGLSEETEFAYQTTVTLSVTPAELDVDILPILETAMAPLVLEQLFSRCSSSESSSTARSTGQWLRKLQVAEIEGWSTRPKDVVIQNVPCVDVDEIFPCFVIRGKTTAYAEGKISDATRQSLADAVRLAIQNGNLATADNRLLEVTYRDLNRFPITNPGGGGQGGSGDGDSDGGTGGKDPNDINGDLDPEDDGLENWAIALIAVGGAVTMCLAYLCLRRPSHSSLDVDDSSSSSSSSSSGSSSSSSDSESQPLKAAPEPPISPAPAPAPPPPKISEPVPKDSPPPADDSGMRLVKVIKRASAKPSPKVAPSPTPKPASDTNRNIPSATKKEPSVASSTGTPVEHASSEEGSYSEPMSRPSPHKQQSAFTLDMGEDLRDNASGLTTDLEFSQANFATNEFKRAPSPFGGQTNEFDKAPSSYDPSSGTPSSSYEEIVEEYEIDYESEEVSGEEGGGDDESSEVFWDEELNDADPDFNAGGGSFT